MSQADETAIVPVQATQVVPRDLYRVSTDVAGVCGEIVKRTAKKIQQRKYVCVEGWQAIASAHGCVLSVDSVSEDEDGNIVAIAAVKRMSDGASLCHAEGFVGVDEKMWQSRPRYARRAMAQTRAMSRAARSAFAHVVVLIDSGLSTTPAEEVPDNGFNDDGHEAAPQEEPAPIVKTTPERAAALMSLCIEKGVPAAEQDKWRKKAGCDSYEEFPADAVEKLIVHVAKMPTPKDPDRPDDDYDAFIAKCERAAIEIGLDNKSLFAGLQSWMKANKSDVAKLGADADGQATVLKLIKSGRGYFSVGEKKLAGAAA